MDISLSMCMDKIKVILDELCKYNIIQAGNIHFIEDIQTIRVAIRYGKYQTYVFNFCREDIDENDPLSIYNIIKHYMLKAYVDLFASIKEQLIGKEEHIE